MGAAKDQEAEVLLLVQDPVTVQEPPDREVTYAAATVIENPPAPSETVFAPATNPDAAESIVMPLTVRFPVRVATVLLRI